jgi:tRNA-Thr(GGU) m(6)t(6)A37 methyltransferase TsaA
VFKIFPVAYVRNGVQEVEREDWEAILSEIIFLPEFIGGLEGLEEYSHVYVIFLLHRKRDYRLSVHPRGDEGLPLYGIFATRSPLHPNNLGLSLVRLLEVREASILVQGLDAVDGTPVIDVKPYIGELEGLGDASYPTFR